MSVLYCKISLLIVLVSHLCSLSGGHVVGNFPPHEAFAIGGTNSVRGYEEGAVGSGRSCAIGCGEVSFPMVGGEPNVFKGSILRICSSSGCFSLLFLLIAFFKLA